MGGAGLFAIVTSLVVVTLAIVFFIRVKTPSENAPDSLGRPAPDEADSSVFSEPDPYAVDLARLKDLAPALDELHRRIAGFSDFESGYLMKKEWDEFEESAASLLFAISRVSKEAIEASPYAGQVALLKRYYADANYRTTRNAEYKTRELELCDALLSNIDGGKSLDLQQRDAVVTDEYSNLVIAGAGSGKTSVVVGKVKYLVERWGVDPSEILVTSFTRASVRDLETRIKASGVEGVSAKTFHALGLRVLGNEYAVAAENALQKHVMSYLTNELISRPKEAAAFLEFFGLRTLAPDEVPDSEEAEVRMKLLKAQDMRTLKGLVLESGRQDGMDTIRGERVKSIEELMIANFLFLNGVEYEYEKPYNREIPQDICDEERRAYQPDFYLVDNDIWLEHFGIDENGRVPWMKTRAEEQKYLDGIKWKRLVHEVCGTKLIESFSFWNKDQDLLNRVEKLLLDNGVELKNDPKRNAEICGGLLRDQRFFSSMSQLICTFISLVKSGNKTVFEVDDAARIAYRENGSMWYRYELFTRFVWPIFVTYRESLSAREKPEIDFDDMINMAADRVRSQGFKDHYRYIIVDEYQDISLSRFGLLSAIRDATGAKLMCVGDDWQAIYRFAGSDVTLFTNFGELVGFYEEMRIERTYRNSQKLVDSASQFVLKNPDQMSKSVISMAPKQRRPPIAVISQSNQRAAFAYALKDLLSSPGGGGEIIVLGRNGRDLERVFPDFAPTKEFSFRDPKRGVVKEDKFSKVIVYHPAGAKPREIGYMTVHKSKGLQADNVVVIGLTNDRCGFPNMIADDPILELLLANSDGYPFAEERRLFYVALTRTKNRVWLVAGEESASPGISLFVNELRQDNDASSLAFHSQSHSDDVVECPRCGGALVKRSGPKGDFVGCSNYPFCTNSYPDVRIFEDRKRCPECGGWLTRKTRKNGGGEFYGCTNYPQYCQYAVNLDKVDDSDEFGAASRSTPRRSYSAVSAEGEKRKPRQANGAGRSLNCPKCGAPMVVRSGAYGKFYGCTNYPLCEGKRSIGGKGRGPSGTHAAKSGGGRKGSISRKCPKCGSKMVLQNGRCGKFYGCSRYPLCKGKRKYLG